MSLSETAVRVSGSLFSKVVRVAKPTSWMRCSSGGRPFQKKVYPLPTSEREPLLAGLVSLKAAMSILNLFNSAAISAVQCARRSESAVSSNVWMFQPGCKMIVPFLGSVGVSTTWRRSPARAVTRLGTMEWTMFRPPFLGPTSCEVSSADPK